MRRCTTDHRRTAAPERSAGRMRYALCFASRMNIRHGSTTSPTVSGSLRPHASWRRYVRLIFPHSTASNRRADSGVTEATGLLPALAPRPGRPARATPSFVVTPHGRRPVGVASSAVSRLPSDAAVDSTLASGYNPTDQPGKGGPFERRPGVTLPADSQAVSVVFDVVVMGLDCGPGSAVAACRPLAAIKHRSPAAARVAARVRLPEIAAMLVGAANPWWEPWKRESPTSLTRSRRWRRPGAMPTARWIPVGGDWRALGPLECARCLPRRSNLCTCATSLSRPFRLMRVEVSSSHVRANSQSHQLSRSRRAT